MDGLVRLNAILAPYGPIPVCKSTWWAGVKDGRYPKPVKLGPGVTAWKAEEIRRLIEIGVSEDAYEGRSSPQPSDISRSRSNSADCIRQGEQLEAEEALEDLDRAPTMDAEYATPSSRLPPDRPNRVPGRSQNLGAKTKC